MKGGDLKIGGVKAGSIAGFKLSDHEPYRSLVEVEVSEPGFDSLRTDAHCDVRQQSLIGEYFIDCDLGQGLEGAALRRADPRQADLVHGPARPDQHGDAAAPTASASG